MGSVPAELRRLVIERAANRCEYCLLSQQDQEATFHIDHVIPVAAQGRTVLENLALACVSCSLRKSARSIARDPQTSEEVPLFNPRRDPWIEHFRWEGSHLVGISSKARATIHALGMNRPLIIAIRQEEAALGRHPPPKKTRT